MCTVVILSRPGHDWPLVFAANRDEMTGRPWLPPGRHWPNRAEVVAGRDQLAGGTWLGLNDWGVIAGVLNRPGSLGPDEALRSRGELPLEALDHAEASAAADALSNAEPSSYRPFNMVIADALDAFWLRSPGNGEPIQAAPIPKGLSMVTAHDMNDTSSPRIRHFLPLFENARPPDPETGDWSEWQALLASRQGDAPEDTPDDTLDDSPGGAMTFATGTGFGTLSSSLLALPRPGREDAKPVWLFAPGPPDETPYGAVAF